MSLRTFLAAADALRLEDGVEFVMQDAAGIPIRPVPSPEQNRARNQDAMAAFNAMMGGVQVGKGR